MVAGGVEYRGRRRERPGLLEVGCGQISAEQRGVDRLNGFVERAGRVAVLVELGDFAVLHDGREGDVGQDLVVEERPEGGFAVVRTGAEVDIVPVDPVVVVLVAIVPRPGRRRIVEADAFDRHLFKRGVSAQRRLDREIVGVGQGRRSEAELVHDGDDSVDVTLHVHAQGGLQSFGVLRDPRVQEDHLRLRLPLLGGRQRLACERGPIRVPPFEREVGAGGVEPLGVGDPLVTVDGLCRGVGAP
jgi:hypothetical protein